jgi:hypothetical protein
MIIFVVFIFVVSPILSLPFSIWGIITNCQTKKVYGYIVITAASLAFVAFHISPEKGMDIYQYYMRMQQMSSLSTLDAAKEAIEGFQVEALSYYLMYFISKTGRYGLYAATSVFFTYTSCLSICCSIGQKKQYQKNEIVFMIFVLISWLASDAIFSGIRYNMAYTFLYIGIYMEYLSDRKKIWSYIMYACSILTHASIAVFILLRIMMPFCKRSKIIRNVLFALMAFWSLFFNYIESFLKGFSFFNITYLSEKVSTYSAVQSSGRFGVFAVRYTRLVLCVLIGICIADGLRHWYKNSEEDYSPQLYSAQVGFLTFGAFNRLIYVSRFFQVFAGLSPYYIIYFIDSFKDRDRIIVKIFLICCSLIMIYNQLSVFEFSLDQSIARLLTPFAWMYG